MLLKVNNYQFGFSIKKRHLHLPLHKIFMEGFVDLSIDALIFALILKRKEFKYECNSMDTSTDKL